VNAPDRRALWLPLLVELTEACPTWSVWKDADGALAGTDDVDALAPRESWPTIERIFRRWALDRGWAVAVCRHIPWTLNLFAVADGELMQLEIKSQVTFRGAVHVTAADTLSVSELDEGGFRRLRPGAEGLIKLTLHGLRRGGRPNAEALRTHRVADALRTDPEGAEAMARTFGAVGSLLLRAASAAADDEWDRPAMLVIEGWAAARAIVRPQITVRREWFRRFRRSRCPVLQTVYSYGRSLPQPEGQWLRRARESGHEVVVPGSDGVRATSGRFVVLVGPDGVGKTTVAAELLARHEGETRYIYFRPPITEEAPAAPPTGPRPRGEKEPPRQARALGWLRLAKNLVWFRLGYHLRIRPVLRRGGLVVADRWGYGYAVQPGPLRFSGPAWLGRLGVRLMPHPDLVANLVADPDVIVARKDELTLEQAAAEIPRWRDLPVPRMATIDASGPTSEVVDRVLRHLGGTRP
jgi:thymidylate kinase